MGMFLIQWAFLLIHVRGTLACEVIKAPTEIKFLKCSNTGKTSIQKIHHVRWDVFTAGAVFFNCPSALIF